MKPAKKPKVIGPSDAISPGVEAKIVLAGKHKFEVGTITRSQYFMRDRRDEHGVMHRNIVAIHTLPEFAELRPVKEESNDHP